MADQPENEWIERGQAERLARREEQRHRRRRRRLGAAAVLTFCALALAGLLVSLIAGSSGGSASSRRAAKAGRRRAGTRPISAHASAGKARNATLQPGWQPHTGPVPILEYHVLGSAAAAAPYPELYVPPPDRLARRARIRSGDPGSGRARLV